MNPGQDEKLRSGSADLNRFCVLDVGSTTTKAIFFKKDSGWQYFRVEKPTTVEAPYEDVTFGVLDALGSLEEISGEKLVEQGRPCLPCFSTSSAGGGLAVVVAGLIGEVTAKSGERVALGAGSIIQEIIALDDGRTPYKKIDLLKTLRPDMILLAGGFDGGAVHGPVFLAEMLSQSNLRPKLSRDMKLPVIYAGNVVARKYIEEILRERFMCFSVPNIRPASSEENLEPARHKIHEVFMEHVMSRAPGYEKYKTWISSPILPTPAAFSRILELASRDLDAKILAVDVGGATTDVFTVEKGKVFRTVSANLGMSYSILNVVRQAGLEAVRELLDFDIDERELYDRIGNKFLKPTGLPADIEDTNIECAVASVAVREAVREHLQVLHGEKLSLTADELGWHMFRSKKRRKKVSYEKLPLEDYDIVIGSGGKLSHSPRATAAMILINALKPERTINLAVDSVFMFPHLGVLSQTDEKLALELFYRFGLVRLGRVVVPTGKAAAGEDAVRLTGMFQDEQSFNETVKAGEVKFIDVKPETRTIVKIKSGRMKTPEKQVELDGNTGGLIIDARGRPPTGGGSYFIPPDFQPPRRTFHIENTSGITRGEIRIRRELAIPGDVFVKPDDTVQADTLIAKSVKSFLRPFFLNIADDMKLEPGEFKKHFNKKIGDEINTGDILLEIKRSLMGATKNFRSQVTGTVEKILPNGTVIVREKLEYAKKLYSVKVAHEMDIAPDEIKGYLKCREGQEIEQGQVLAGFLASGKGSLCRSPVRGKVKEINYEFGAILIEPLLEELQLTAWLPGKVEKVSDKGCTVINKGTVIRGSWGSGEQIAGIISFDKIEPGGVAVMNTTDDRILRELAAKKAAGLITGGLHLKDFNDFKPKYSVIVIEGFGEIKLAPETHHLFKENIGRLACLDPTTQLRAGVRRPRVIIPDIQ